LDHVLLTAARDAGVSVVTGARVDDVLRDASGRVSGVSGRTIDGEPFTAGARLVIGADGLRSVVARRLKLLRRRPRLRKASCSIRLSGFTDAGSLGELHIGPEATAGFAPISAPEASGACEVNLTVVVPAGRARNSGGARPLLWSAARSIPTLREQLARLETLDAAQRPPVLASGPFDLATRDVMVPGAVLAGDAAGYFDPFTGQGIYHALADARILSASVPAALGARSPRDEIRAMKGYARQHRRMIREAEALQRLIDAVIRRPQLASLAVHRLAHAHAAADALIAATGDLRRARSLLLPRVLLALLAPTGSLS
ncbi:MAG TPA: FAD-dependent monooxygenase, partial [Longimicrobiales bacterium]|nr:FAD-dependent monooxygenase [Longimicrobiales bacterium]